MQYLKLSEDKYVEIDDQDNSRVIDVSSELEVCDTNIQGVEANIVEAQSRLVSTDVSDLAQKQVLEAYNSQLGIESMEQELASWKDRKEQLVNLGK